MILFVLMTVLSVGGFVESADSYVAQAFKDNDIVPDIILKAPQDLIRVNYKRQQVNLGSTILSMRALLEPKVAFDAEDSELYTLMFFGPDLLSDVFQTTTMLPETTLSDTTLPDTTETSPQLLHWLIVNIPGTHIEDGDVIVPYFSPTSYLLGQFNYIFLLYKQNATIDTNQLVSLSTIESGFDVTDFQRKYKLTGPLAGNFMKVVFIPRILEPSKIIY